MLPVEIEMVLRQVCEHRRVELHASDPILGQRVGGHFHDCRLAAGVAHLAEQRL